MNSEKIEITKFILYHILNDESCAEVRRFIVQNELTDKVLFRNIDRSKDAADDLLTIQGSHFVPFLADNNKFYRGSAEILRFLQGLRVADDQD